MTVIKNDELLDLLKQKGFALKTYLDQGLTFYTLTYSDPGIVKEFFKKFYDEEQLEENIDNKDVQFVVEIQDNFESPQWCFTNGLEKHHMFENVFDFEEFVKELPDKQI